MIQINDLYFLSNLSRSLIFFYFLFFKLISVFASRCFFMRFDLFFFINENFVNQCERKELMTILAIEYFFSFCRCDLIHTEKGLDRFPSVGSLLVHTISDMPLQKKKTINDKKKERFLSPLSKKGLVLYYLYPCWMIFQKQMFLILFFKIGHIFHIYRVTSYTWPCFFGTLYIVTFPV